MRTVEQIQEVLNEKNISAGQMMKDLGFSSGLFSQWKSGKQNPSLSKLEKIAEYLGVTVEYLRKSELRDKAIEKFGFCWDYSKREQLKAEARNLIDENSLTDEELLSKAIIIYKALFSRSLEESGYSLNHVDFETYCAMMLNQESGNTFTQGNLSKERCEHLIELLIDKFGKKEGINEGTYYTCYATPKFTKSKRNITISKNKVDEELKFALFNGTEGVTDEMFNEVKQFAEMVKMRENAKRKETK